jgi:hypothetical protein
VSETTSETAADPGRDAAILFNHVGLCVTDLDRSRRFYEEVLGFRHWWEMDVPDEGTAKLLQLEPPLGVKAVYLVKDRFVIELLHYSTGVTRPPISVCCSRKRAASRSTSPAASTASRPTASP